MPAWAESQGRRGWRRRVAGARCRTQDRSASATVERRVGRRSPIANTGIAKRTMVFAILGKDCFLENRGTLEEGPGVEKQVE